MLSIIDEYFAKSLKISRNGAIRKPGYGLLFAFHSNWDLVIFFLDKATMRHARFPIYIPL